MLRVHKIWWAGEGGGGKDSVHTLKSSKEHAQLPCQPSVSLLSIDPEITVLVGTLQLFSDGSLQYVHVARHGNLKENFLSYYSETPVICPPP